LGRDERSRPRAPIGQAPCHSGRQGSSIDWEGRTTPSSRSPIGGKPRHSARGCPAPHPLVEKSEHAPYPPPQKRNFRVLGRAPSCCGADQRGQQEVGEIGGERRNPAGGKALSSLPNKPHRRSAEREWARRAAGCLFCRAEGVLPVTSGLCGVTSWQPVAAIFDAGKRGERWR